MPFRRLRNFEALTLRSKLVIGGVLILLLPLVFIETTVFVRTTGALEEISKTQMVQVARSLSDMVRLALEKDLKTIGAVARDPRILREAQSGRYEMIAPMLAELHRDIGADYEGLAVFDATGTIRADGVDESRIGISISEREYFQNAENGGAGIGPLVASKATGNPIFAIYAPMKSSDGRFLGGVLAVVEADYLMRYISSLKLGRSGYALMIDRDGIVVAHPDKSFILTLDTRKVIGIERLIDRMTHGESGTEEFTFQGVRKIMGFAPVAPTGWSIGVTQQKDEIMALAYGNRDFILLVSGIFLGLTILALYFFSSSVSTPVQKTLTTLSQAISQATEAVFIVGLDKGVQFVNPAMATIVDRPIDALVGKALEIEPADSHDAQEIWRALAKKGSWSGRITGGRTDSTVFTMELVITPIRGDSGRITCFLGVGRDVTRDLEMQARMRQAEKMEAIGTLAGGIAHDFNNILGAVFGFAELALISLDDRASTEKYLNGILDAANRARELVNGVLSFSRRTELGKKPMIPKYIIKEALKLIRASLPSTIEIQEALKSSAAVLGDPTQLHQVVVNLCTNAGYAMKEKGGVLEVSLDEAQIESDGDAAQTGLRPGKYLRMVVKDGGCGIPARIAGRIFDPFFTTKPPGEGTGLGLSVVHGIVKDFQGAIAVSSEIGKGTSFTIHLPIIQTEEALCENERLEKPPRGKERILLVDDEVNLLTAGTEILESLGYSVRGYTRGELAFDAISRDPQGFDALVTDYTMPQMTGGELAKKVRELRPNIPIVLCSGDFFLKDKIRDIDGIEFLRKPFTTADIAFALRRALGPSASS